MCLNYTQSHRFSAFIHRPALLYLSVLLISSTRPPFTMFICLRDPIAFTAQWVCVCVSDRQTLSAPVQSHCGAESWIRLSKPCGLGRRHILNHILSYLLCLPNLCHATWELAECVLSACVCLTQHTIQSDIFLSLFAAGKDGHYTYMYGYKYHVNSYLWVKISIMWVGDASELLCNGNYLSEVSI